MKPSAKNIKALLKGFILIFLGFGTVHAMMACQIIQPSTVTEEVPPTVTALIVATEALAAAPSKEENIIQTSVQKEIAIDLLSAEWTAQQAAFVVKFPLVDKRDWHISKAELISDGQTFELSSGTLLEMVSFPVNGKQTHMWKQSQEIKAVEIEAGSIAPFRKYSILFNGIPFDFVEKGYTLRIKALNSNPN